MHLHALIHTLLSHVHPGNVFTQKVGDNGIKKCGPYGIQVFLCLFSTAKPCRTRASTSSRTFSHSARRCQTQLPVVSLKFMETAEVKEGEAFMAVPGVSFGLDELFPKN